MNNKFQEAITPNEEHPSEVSMEFKSENPILSEADADPIIESVEVNEDVELDATERLFDDEVTYRTIDLSRASYIDEDNRRVRMGVSSERACSKIFWLRGIKPQSRGCGYVIHGLWISTIIRFT